MSLIEKAIEKMRAAGGTGTTGQFPALRTEPQVAAPQANDTPVPPVRRRANAGPPITIDTAVLTSTGILAPPAKVHQQASEYRQIKRQLLATLRPPPGELPRPSDRLIMIASAVSGEGKTFNSINLAMSLSLELDYNVLLVDADVVRPTVSRLFGVEERAGLLDAARDEKIDIEDLIVGTNMRGLSLLPAGHGVENATEYLSSARMASVLNQLVADPARLVLLDSPPLLMTTESAALSQLTGRVILVVRADSTPHRAVLDALDVLGERPGVRLILNGKTHSSVTGYYYGYNAYKADSANKAEGHRKADPARKTE